MSEFNKAKSEFREILSLSLRGFSLLSNSGRRTILIYSFSLSVISLLDALGLGLLAYGLSNTSRSSLELGNKFLYLLLFVFLIFISRSLLAVLISYLGLRSLAYEEVLFGERAFQILTEGSWLDVRKLSLSDLQMQIDRSANALIQNFLFINATIASEIFNALIIVCFLVVVSPMTAVISGVYFALVSVIQHFALSKSSSRSGVIVAKEFGNVYSLLDEYSQFGKILRIMEATSLSKSLRDSREQLAKARASAAFLSAVPRYFMEAVLAIGCLLIFAATYVRGGSDDVLPALAIFAGAGFRLLPIVNKIQGSILVLFSSFPLAKTYFRLAETVHPSNNLNSGTTSLLDEETLVRLEKVSFSYPDSNRPVLTNVDLDFKRGKQYAIVGNSGSGKTTLTEIIVGLLPPTSGRRMISSSHLVKFGYVPQDTPILLGTIKQNVAMSWNSSDVDDGLLSEVLENVQLQGLMDDLESRRVADGPSKLLISVGQRQRVGIARALYHKSNLLILDEPTSSLDTVLESQLVELLMSLKAKCTTIIVSHRLTTIQKVDEIIFIEDGEITATGSYDDLCQNSETFRKLIELSTLSTD